MQKSLVQLVKVSIFYSSGLILARFINLLISPITTSYLSPKDYGIIGTLNVIDQFIGGLYTMGLGIAIMRFYSSSKNAQKQCGIIWTSFFIILFNIIDLAIIAYLFRDKISFMLLDSDTFADLLLYSLSSLGLASLLIPFHAFLRCNERIFLISAIQITEVLITVSLTLYFMIVLKMSTKAVIIPAFIGRLFSLLITMIITCPKLPFYFSWECIPKMVHAGMSHCLSGIGYTLLLATSVYTAKMLTPLDQVGLLFKGICFGQAIDLVILGFLSAWYPFVSKHPDPSKITAQVMNYYAFAIGSILLIIFIISKPIVYIIVQPAYYSIWKIVGIWSAGRALWGVYGIASTPLFLEKKNGVKSLLELSAGATCIMLNMLMIPIWGNMGAAFATFFSYLFLVVATLQLCKIRYPIKRAVSHL